ncbi:angiopoietin-2b [Mastacembelus armatus]|uniref:Angiopoietin 2b n=1 Tax=Mastacembelus armatus TaxID=205130 RepID=A0A3Q3LB85_9TELE|nr:angiopoietin-2-like [Mastacembelus armatus]XP_026156917.1 angiopoietin-2-like [Mastacembelus armatus]XP_026156918.1 angiopoietin-2-like [Mastacembelus armatus]XP_026156919.1 angiopoietin-2-like [Mastacembelus armatus]
MDRLLALTLAYLAYLLAAVLGSERQQHRMQHGPCSYTFILPEVEHCHPLKDFQVSNTLQRDSPPESERDTGQSKQGKVLKERPSLQERKLERLESAMENNTQWLQKLENFIQENVRSGMEEMKRTAVHTQTAAMLEMGTNLLSQSAEQTRKLTDVETQVLNQTSRLEIQLLEYSLFTNRLEKHILLQTQEISRLSDKNSFLEQRLLALEAQYGKELQGLQSEKQQLQELLERQSRMVSQLQGELGSSALNSTLLQRQQAMLTDTVQQLLAMVNHCNEISNRPKEELLTFRDCAEILRSGVAESGIYSIRLPNSTQTVKVFCDMKTRGGGWTVLQHRTNGSVDFYRGWREYKMGFGEPSGEHWLGNEIIHKLTSSQEYSLHVQLQDREGNEAFSHYDRFYIDGEDNNYSLHAEGFSGTAGRTSSLAHTGTQFSTKDRDNDRCTCKCAQLASGGWWFDACGPSNLNGIYYPASSNVVRYNGIKWYYWKGPNMMTIMTTMMVRPKDF